MAHTIRYDSGAPDDEGLHAAAKAIRNGSLVVFPTETVYGLGAHALDPVAVGRIYLAKGRPASNPLIVHVADTAMARDLADEWPPVADRIAARFWPGPVTIVVPRNSMVPDVTTAGGSTVAIRVPAHPAALGLIKLAGVPVAAPSANESGMVSPTRVEHLTARIRHHAAWIVDAGPCKYGLESTVVDVCVEPVRVLRPGAISRAHLESIIEGPVALGPEQDTSVPRSPGLLGRHYAPRAELSVIREPSNEAREWLHAVSGGAWLTHDPRLASAFGPGVEVIAMPSDPAEYGRILYATLQELDARGVRRILALEPPDTVEWEAVRDRLHRAALG